ncbi:MAG TPA: acyltransferase family protein [Steroidobacteraceae bacterium]|jgi:peptidoglycan/LPS O-acetylase OafA/YrhL|nr:acyltransferase family protein [Steroidobacteraceae bacterium]
MSNHQYRPDVDGLRAIAVLSVILFHVDASLLPGGFVGVDIFFVISGFLISRNILEELARGRFSIGEFYRRRVKRIAPPMLIVVGVTLLAAQLLMLPEDIERAADSALWSLASLANVFFWTHHDGGYFAAASHDQPLLHLWSLGVEEQFYILWPLLLLLVHRARWLFLGAGLVALASFALGEIVFARDPSFAYYMLPTRAGELLLGGMVALASLRGVERRLPAAAVTPIALLGLALMVAPLFMLSEESVFPGVLAAPPTLGTALLILAGHCAQNPISRALSLRPLVWIGLVSYSAYLWHWPLLALYRYGGHAQLGAAPGVVLVAATFALAWMTYRFIETPARRSRGSVRQVVSRQYVIPALALAALSLVVMKLDGFGWRSDEYRQALAAARQATRPAHQYDYVCQRMQISPADLSNPACVLGPAPHDRPQAILWGDSNAAHYIGVVGAFAELSDFSFRNLAIGACPPLFSDPTAFVASRRTADCLAAAAPVRDTVRRFPVVIVSASYTAYLAESAEFLDAFEATVRALANEGRLVIVIGKAPVIEAYDRRCREKALTYPLMDCRPFTAPQDPDVTAANARLRDFAARMPRVEYFDVTDYLCSAGRCSPFEGDRPLYYDSGHLSMPASWDLGKRIVREDGVPAPFRLIESWAAQQFSQSPAPAASPSTPASTTPSTTQ